MTFSLNLYICCTDRHASINDFDQLGNTQREHCSCVLYIYIYSYIYMHIYMSSSYIYVIYIHHLRIYMHYAYI